MTKDPSPEEAARDLVRRALKASLATLDRTSGHPYASLVTVATDADATPLLLISKLALHTQNILADTRASLLFDGTNTVGDPLAGGRVTLLGRIEAARGAHARARFLARQTAAAGYADFPDFGFFQLTVERAHYIGGFGRIVSLDAADLVIDLTGAEALVDAEADIIAHMNDDHADAAALYATVLAGAANGAWRVSGVDPLGFDLVADGDARRIGFASRVTSPEGARKEFVRLVQLARSKREPI